jgi:phosphonate degradation associated HDIG domain protein
MNQAIALLDRIYRTQGQQQYDGEAVSQLEHALQCASLAEAAHQSPAMIAACLLHDLGHLWSDEDAVEEQRHEYRAMVWLQQWFSPAVTEPIRLHVQAKQYLCAVDTTYWANLSPASQESLIQQGGIFSNSAAEAFLRQPYALDAIHLRHWDDQAKVVGLSTPDLSHYLAIIQDVIGG